MGFLSKLFTKKEEILIYYSIVYKLDNVKLTLTVNGNEVINDSYEFASAGSRPINEWIKVGDNSLGLHLSVIDLSREYWNFDILLTKAEKGQYSDEGEQLLNLNFNQENLNGSLPFDQSFNFIVDEV